MTDIRHMTCAPRDTETVLSDIVRQAEAICGGAFVGAFLDGSAASGNDIPTSDIDLRVVVHALPPPESRRAMREVVQTFVESTGREIEAKFEVLNDLVRVGAVRFQRSRHLGGRDIRSEIPLKPMESYVLDTVVSAHDLVLGCRNRVAVVPIRPLPYPAEGGLLQGYAQRQVLSGGRWRPSTKLIVTLVTAIATALIALNRGAYVFSKGECADAYRTLIGDRWGDLVEASLRDLRGEWHYLLPENPDLQFRLEALCAETLAFENHFLSRSIPVLEQLTGSSETRLREGALNRLQRLGRPFPG